MDQIRWQRTQARARVLAKFALKDDNGDLVKCDKCATWVAGVARPKVTFPSEAYARRTAGAFDALGEDKQEAYLGAECHLWHVRQAAKRRARERSRALLVRPVEHEHKAAGA